MSSPRKRVEIEGSGGERRQKERKERREKWKKGVK